MITIGLFDKGNGKFYRPAYNAALEIFGPDVASQFSTQNVGFVEPLRSFTHIVCHLEEVTPEPSWRNLIDGSLTGVQVIVRVSSQGATGMESFTQPFRMEPNGPWIFHLIEGSGTVDVQGWKRILSAFKDWNPSDSSPSVALMEIFDPRPDARLALRLLCEAWEQVHVLHEPNPNGIAIHPLASLADWLAPFDPSGATDDERIVEVGTMLGGGDLKISAETVLKAVAAQTGLKAAIEEFLRISTSSAQGN